METHRERIVNYGYYQEEQICSIGSGAVESTVKQIDRRLKISGAQWNKENISQVLKHRCAYLNNCLGASHFCRYTISVMKRVNFLSLKSNIFFPFMAIMELSIFPLNQPINYDFYY